MTIHISGQMSKIKLSVKYKEKIRIKLEKTHSHDRLSRKQLIRTDRLQQTGSTCRFEKCKERNNARKARASSRVVCVNIRESGSRPSLRVSDQSEISSRVYRTHKHTASGSGNDARHIDVFFGKLSSNDTIVKVRILNGI